MSMGSLLFSFRGRINRKPYWIVSVAVWVAMAVAVAQGVVGDFEFWLAAFMILLIPLAWISFALAAKRLHDRNKSAWWLVFFYVLPGLLESMASLVGGAEIVLSIASMAISIWALVELGFLRGTPGPNDYGPDPLTGASPAIPPVGRAASW
jgi:uncharacterized membrane protein YhaH (DUF805 family)